MDIKFVGAYSILRRVTNLISTAKIISNWIIVSDISKSYAVGDKEKLEKLANNSLKISSIIASLIAVPAIVSFPFWSRHFSLEYSVTNLSVMGLLCLSQFVHILSGSNFLFASQCGLEEYALKIRIQSFVLALLIVPVFSHVFQIFGLSVAVFLVTIFYNYRMTAVNRRMLGIDTTIFKIFT